MACGIDLDEIIEFADVQSGSGNTIVNAGRLVRENRVDVLLGTLQALPASLAAQLAIYGEGPEREAIRLYPVRRLLPALGRVKDP